MTDIKTKEDVVRENYEKVFSSQKYDNSVNKEMNKLYFFPAMDEYAKQRCIAFMEAYQFGRIEFEKEPDSIEELYQLFIQSLNLNT